jgi:hypothetical protein
MAQLVGQTCVLCAGRIASILDGRFCPACGSPVHDRCIPERLGEPPDTCPTCGAPARVAEEHRARSQEDDARRDRLVRSTHGLRSILIGLLWLGGGAAYSLISILGHVAAHRTGPVYIAVGAILFGLLQISFGIAHLWRAAGGGTEDAGPIARPARWTYGAIATVIAVGVVAMIVASSKEREPGEGQPAFELGEAQTTRVMAGTPEEDGWVEARPAGGHFSVRLPGPFNEFTQVATAGDGRRYLMRGVGVFTPEGGKYTATEITGTEPGDVPPDPHRAVVASAEREGRLLSRRAIALDGHPGEEVVIETKVSTAIAREFRVGVVRITLLAEYPPQSSAELQAEGRKFHDSLRLLE